MIPCLTRTAPVAIVMFVMFLGLILSGYPVAFSFAFTAVVFTFIGIGIDEFEAVQLRALTSRWFGYISDQTLLAIPFFVYMGAIFEKSGQAERLLTAIGRLMGPLRGGLALTVVVVGTMLGAATGVYLSGTWMDGRGGALPTFAGALVGGAASTGLYAAGMGRDDPSTLFLLALPLAGAITAFEVSSALRPPRPRAARLDGPHLVPTVGVTPDGGTLGLAGRF